MIVRISKGETIFLAQQIGKVSGEKDPLSFDVTGLDEGEEYLFRVTAINDEGESEPLVADAAIKAKNPFGKFRLRSNILYTLTTNTHPTNSSRTH